jgi:hypothetical protein
MEIAAGNDSHADPVHLLRSKRLIPRKILKEMIHLFSFLFLCFFFWFLGKSIRTRENNRTNNAK